MTNAGTGLVRVGRDRQQRRVHRAVAADRPVHRQGRAAGLQDGERARRRPRRRLAHAHQRPARGRRRRGVGDGHRLVADCPDLVVRAGHDGQRGGDQDAAAQRPQLRQPDAHRFRASSRGIPGANIDGAGSLAWRASASFSANGQRPRDNNYMLDGVDNNETWLQTVVLFPSVDALDEFKLQTSTYSAEFGRSLGGVVNLQIKSGTNAMHGSGFEFLRNDAFDANNFFNIRAGRAKPDVQPAPVRRDLSAGRSPRTRPSYFFDYQGFRVNQGQTYLSTVPSARMRRAISPRSTAVIYDPRHGPAVPRQRHPASALGSGGEEHPRPADPGRRIPPARGADGPDDQQLSDQPDARAAGQPDRRQGRSPADDEQPVLHAATATRKRTASCRRRCRTAMPDSRSAPATATSRRRVWRSTTRTPSARTG